MNYRHDTTAEMIIWSRMILGVAHFIHSLFGLLNEK